MDEITYPWWDQSWTMFVKGAPGAVSIWNTSLLIKEFLFKEIVVWSLLWEYLSLENGFCIEKSSHDSKVIQLT